MVFASTPSPTPILTLPHLLLRPWEAADAPTLFAILQEPGLLRYVPRQDPPPLERVERYIAHHQAHWQERGYGHWAVIERANGQLIGWSGLEYLPDSAETEVAYLLSHSAWGRGYATTAARAAIEFGFASAGLEAITGLVHPENLASRRVLEKCGLAQFDQVVYWGLGLLRYRILRPATADRRRLNGDR
jgi:RimJ/RimL family protein N-acetyltransferase